MAGQAKLITAGGGGIVLTPSSSIGADVTVSIPAATTSLAGTAVASVWTAPQRSTPVAADSGTFNFNTAGNFTCTPTAAITLTFTNIVAGQSGLILLTNPYGYAVSKAATVKVAGSTLATISTAGTYLLTYTSLDGVNVIVTTSGAVA